MLDEREAIRRCLAGDKDAFTVLVRQYQALILAICLRMTGSREDAADLAQQAFVKAYRRLGQYDPAQPFRPWLCRVATNECIAFLRRRRSGSRTTPAPIPDDIPSDEAHSPPALAELATDRAQVSQAVAELPLHYRTVVLLFYFQELSYQEIAAQTGLPPGTIATHLHRAKQLLRQKLTAAEVNPGVTS